MQNESLLAGNGHEKVFSPTKAKTSADLARERLLRDMPEVRREVSRMNLSIGAKWFFDRISDDSFWEVMGGDRFGSVCTTIKNMSIFYSHNRDPLSRQLRECVDAGILWVETSQKVLIIHISAFVPAPNQRVHPAARAKARALHAVRASNFSNNHQEQSSKNDFTNNDRESNFPHPNKDENTSKPATNDAIIEPPRSPKNMFHVEQSSGDSQSCAQKVGTTQNTSESQQNHVFFGSTNVKNVHLCPESGHNVHRKWAQRAQKVGTTCPESGHNVHRKWAQVHKNVESCAQKVGTTCTESGHNVTRKWAQCDQKMGTKNDESAIKMRTPPASNMSPDLKCQDSLEVLKACKPENSGLQALEKNRHQQISMENRFLSEVLEMMRTCQQRTVSVETEMKNFGGTWRLAFRENPNRAERSLAEVRSMVKEGRIREFPSAAVFAGAKGIWEIFGGGKISRRKSDYAAGQRSKKQNQKE